MLMCAPGRLPLEAEGCDSERRIVIPEDCDAGSEESVGVVRTVIVVGSVPPCDMLALEMKMATTTLCR